MKKIINTAILLCLTAIAFSQEQKEANTITLNVVATFGRLGADCSGRGVCSFSETTDKTQENTTILYNKDNTISLVIDHTKITKEDALKIIGTPLTASFKVSQSTFVMEESLELSSAMQSRLQTPVAITKITKGSYPLTITKESLIIILKME